MTKFILISLISTSLIAGCAKTDDTPVTQFAAPQVSSEVYGVMIDYLKPQWQMVDEGKYDWRALDITSETFPITGSGTVEVKLRLVHFGRRATTKEVTEYLESNGLQAGKVEDLLAFGAKYPEKQREFSIVALGSAWVNSVGSRFVPTLEYDSTRDGIGSRRGLSTGYDDGPSQVWGSHNRFLAVSN